MHRIFLGLLLCTTLSTVQAQWISGAPSSTRYDDVFFINDTLGWAAGGNNFRIYKSTDGGLNWQEKFNTAGYLRSIEFATEELGFAGSLNRALFRSTDGGETWTNIYDNISPAPPINADGICGLSAPSANVIYGCGDWTAPAYVIKTVNGGDNWELIDMSAYAETLVDILFLDEMHGYVTGRAAPGTDGGIILETLDGGESWQVIHETGVPGDYVWKIQTPDSVHFFGSIQASSNTDDVRILKSTDSAKTWTSVTVAEQYAYMQMVGFLDSLHGWTGGLGLLFETTDGGDTWSQVALGYNYNRFFRINDSTAFLSGRRIYKYAPWQEPPAPLGTEPVTEADRLTLYPNPSQGPVTVEAELRWATYCQLQLIDASGKILEMLDDRYLPAGMYSYTIDLDDYAGSVFFVILKTDVRHYSQKLLKE